MQPDHEQHRRSQPAARGWRLLPARPRLASAGLHAGLQDLGAALAAPGAALAQQHDLRDHRSGLRARHAGRARRRHDRQLRQTR
ncbi:hypothetical protein QO058_19210 [Bosea vestrisii]|nr:hypothetical protein [Bosea vestrisii]WID94934.1 hypothetical protein QO058_19210 [Bosea vestrisii]